MLILCMSHSQERGAFYSSADVSIAYRYWVKHPVLLDYRPADCVTTSASNTGCFVMSARNGKPCKRCGSQEWDNHGHCRVCTRENARRRYLENPEKKKAEVRQWKHDNPEKVYATNRRWRLANMDKSRGYGRATYRKNPDRHAESSKRWQRENPAKQREINRRNRQKYPDKDVAKTHRYRARKKEAAGDYTAQEWMSLVEQYEGKCLCCGRADSQLTVDHVVPLSMGGNNTIDNLQPLCKSCNSRKRDKTIDYRPGAGIGRWIQRKLFG